MKVTRDELTEKVIGCAIAVHRELGPGLLESTYEQCLARELSLNGVGFEMQVPLAVNYKGVHIDCGYRIDLLVEGRLLLELKSVEQIAPIHEAQILTYLKLSKIPQGLLINFNVRRLLDGLKSYLNTPS
ncbi:MAG: GxxExxY protein [Terrimicrobiaceae bacterium]